MATNSTGKTDEKKEDIDKVKSKAKSVGKTTAKSMEAMAKSQQKLKPKNEQLIYVGPNLHGGRLSRFTVFKEGIPEYLKDMPKTLPSIKHLIVPISNFAQTLSKVNTPGTLEHKAFQDLNERKGDK